MATQHIIHRGQHEIGGMCIEVRANDGTRILLDLGMPLVAPDGSDFTWGTPQRPTAELIAEGVLVDVPGLFPQDALATGDPGAAPPDPAAPRDSGAAPRDPAAPAKPEPAGPAGPTVAAIILTHSHLDHYGLAHHAHPSIPVYGSEGTVAVLEVSRVFSPSATLPADLRRLPAEEPLRIGGVTVTAIPVDHAAPDSRALLIEADGQRLLYTGDLRAHGRTGFRFENMLKDERLRGVDWLLIEGTTLGSSGGTHGLRAESDVEEKLVELAHANGARLIAVVASGQNVDRLVSCFRAARSCGRQLVIDAYQAYVLMKLAGLSKNIPQFTWEDVRISFPAHQVEFLKEAGLMDLAHEMGGQARLSSDHLAAEPARYLICCRGSRGTTKLFDKVGAGNVVLVWSMWSGYWQRDGCAMRAWAEREGVDVHFLHSGGHAWPEDLHRLADAIGAKNQVWVHTDCEDPGASA